MIFSGARIHQRTSMLYSIIPHPYFIELHPSSVDDFLTLSDFSGARFWHK